MTSLAAAASILLAVAVITVAARALGAVARQLGQPAVMGEIVTGVVLGSAAVAALAPALHGWLTSERSATALGHVGSVGVVVFIFLVAAELDFTPLRRRARVPALVATGSFLVPFGLGLALAPLVRETAAPGVPAVPKPALPSFHAVASKGVLNQSSPGFPVV